MATGKPLTEEDLTAIEAGNATEDRICITRQHESNEIAWRFAMPQGDPHSLMLWTLFYSMMVQSGYRARIEELERRMAELEAK